MTELSLLVICPHFAPDTAPTGTVMTRLVTELAARGHRIDVVTSLPWYRNHRVEPAWRGRPVRVERTGSAGGAVGAGEAARPETIVRLHPMAAPDKTNVARRAVAFGGFSIAAAVAGAALRRRPYDALLAMSPPITLFASGRLAALGRGGVPLVANIQDVFPDVAIELGVIRGRRTIRFFRWIERKTYAMADAVTVLSDDLRSAVAPRCGDARKVRVIPNFVDTEAIRPTAGPAYRVELGVGDRVSVMYAGNLGFSQPFELLVDTARLLRHRPDIVLVINGQGAARQMVEGLVMGLDNVILGDFQPAERLSEVLAAGDIHVVPLKPGLSAASVPSKTYSILASGRPIISSVDPGTEIERVIDRSGAGIAAKVGDPQSLADAIIRLADDPGQRAEMGRRGRAFVEHWASPAAVAEAYEALFLELIERRDRAPGRSKRNAP